MAKRPAAPPSDTPPPAGGDRPRLVPRAKRGYSAAGSAGVTEVRAPRRRGLVIPKELIEAKKKLVQDLGGLGACIRARLLEPQTAERVGLGNVRGVYIGYKVRDGHYTGELAVKVQVGRKVSSPGRVDPVALIPPTVRFGGKEFPTDVEVVGPIAAYRHIAPEDPAEPGTSISPQNGPTGTFGCLVVVRKSAGEVVPCILSNTHVLGMNAGGGFGPRAKDGVAGQDIVQPGSVDFSSGGTNIATLWNYSDLTLSDVNNPAAIPTSFVDAAVAATDDPRDAHPLISPSRDGFDIEDDPFLDDSTDELHSKLLHLGVRKDGRETEITFGTITGVHHDCAVGYGERPPGSAPYAHFANGLQITGQDGKPFSMPGDSGSLIVEAATGRPVALLVGGDGHFTYANPIGDVMDALEIRSFLNSKNLNDLP